jgi:glycerophosphoryl diester phosphodiesterase
MNELMQRMAMSAVDSVMAAIPRPVPERVTLEHCKIISHRGEHDNVTILENTLLAYEQAIAAGVWGIEADIRFTADLVPVICHDPTTERVFGLSLRVAEVGFEQLRRELPLIPTLAELIEAFGSSTHLMLEIKDEPRPDAQRQKQQLKDLLDELVPAQDFHVLALTTELFDFVDFLPPHCLLPVAELNTRAMSSAALSGNWSGLAGHYLLLTEALRLKHADRRQKIGTGFPTSKNCLFRELNRGVDWIFSNDAVKLQRIVDRCLSRLD